MFCILTERKTISAWAGFKTVEEGRRKIILYKLCYISKFVLHKLHNKSYIINKIKWYYNINFIIKYYSYILKVYSRGGQNFLVMGHFQNFLSSFSSNFIPSARGFQFFGKFPKMFLKKVIFGSESQSFHNKWHLRWCLFQQFWVYVILKASLKLKGRKQSLEGHTLATPGL